jgi:hypothetical protein
MHGAKPAVNAKAYPRTYTASTFQRLLWVTLSTFAVGLGISGAFSLGLDGTREPLTRAFFVALFFLFSAIGGYQLLRVVKTKITLTANTIEIHGPFHSRKLTRGEIRSFHIQSVKGGEVLAFTTNANETVCAQLFFPMDKAFSAWLKPIRKSEQEKTQA